MYCSEKMDREEIARASAFNKRMDALKASQSRCVQCIWCTVYDWNVQCIGCTVYDSKLDSNCYMNYLSIALYKYMFY